VFYDPLSELQQQEINVLLNRHLNIMVLLLYYVWEGLLSNFRLETCYSKAYFVFLLYLSRRILDLSVNTSQVCNVMSLNAVLLDMIQCQFSAVHIIKSCFIILVI